MPGTASHPLLFGVLDTNDYWKAFRKSQYLVLLEAPCHPTFCNNKNQVFQVSVLKGEFTSLKTLDFYYCKKLDAKEFPVMNRENFPQLEEITDS